MIRYIGKRLLAFLPILLGISLLTFLLMHTSSADAIDVMESNRGSAMSEAEKANLRAELGLDKSLPEQYISWLGGILTGDMGESYISGKPVAETFFSKLTATLQLTLASILLTVLVSVPLGILAAVKQNTPIDYLIRGFSFLGNALPNYFLAFMLLYYFALQWKLLPVIARTGDPKSMLLPTLTLSFPMISKYTRQVRAAVLEELGKDYVWLARSLGIRESRILLCSVLKSSLFGIATLLSLSIGSLLGGTAIIESVFLWDGVGKMAVDAINMRDYPVIQAYVIWMAVIYMLINLVMDLVYYLLDPRIRLGDKKDK